MLDETGWRAPTRGDNFDPLVDLWWDPTLFNRTPVDTVAQLQGYKAGVLIAEFGNAKVRNPNERGPWFLSENISIARTFGFQRTRLEFRFEVFNLLNRTIWGNPDSTHHECELRARDDIERRAAPDADWIAVRVLTAGDT